MTARPIPASRTVDASPVQSVVQEVGKRIVGQEIMIERLLVGLLSCGHILLEGVPGLAKTLAVKTLAEIVDVSFSRIQFTPDLLPADLIGTMVFDPKGQEFRVKQGPIFAQLVLADEINRAPAKVQAALLEAMQEHQVTIGGTSFALEEPFLVLATQNPIETRAPIPSEAQLDRFMLKVRVGYPSRDEEKEVLLRMSGGREIAVERLLEPASILAARAAIADLYMDQKVVDYIVDLVRATRDPGSVGLAELKPLIAFGGSPRASIALAQAARAHAFLRGRGYVVPEDVRALAPDVLRHRIVLTFEAEAEDVNSDQVVPEFWTPVPVPFRATGTDDKAPSRNSRPEPMASISPDTEAVKGIELRSRGLVTALFGGEYRSVFRGQGMEFAEVRQYEHGDDFRAIDWNVSARLGHPYIKTFVEERELTLMLIVDQSGSTHSACWTKSAPAVEVASVLALRGQHQRPGGQCCLPKVEQVIRRGRAPPCVTARVRDLVAFADRAAHQPRHRAALRHRAAASPSIVVVPRFLAEGMESAAPAVARRHDVVAIAVEDPRESELPDAGWLELEDAETGVRRTVDTGDRGVRGRLRALAERRREERNRAFTTAGVDHVALDTKHEYASVLRRAFAQRARRISR
jgi:MoxR-like ATPase